MTPVIWGATFPAAKVALEHVTPWTFVAWSRGLGLVAIAAVLLVRRPPREAWTPGLVPAGVLLGTLMTAGYALQTVGIDHTTVLHAVDKIQTLLQEDPKLRKTIDSLIQSINL